MTQINWALGQGGGFENALAQGFQVGSQIRQRREEGEKRNALAAYATNPTPEALNCLAQYAPEFVISERARMQQSGAQGIAQFRPVLEQVQQNPAMWPQARAAAIQGGIDASRIPEAYDPQWVQGQMLFIQADEDGSLPGIARELQAAGIDVATPQGQQVLRNVIEGRYATEYVDQEGNTRRRSPFSLPSVGAQDLPPPPAGFVIDEPTMQNTPAPQLGANGLPSVLTRQQYSALVNEAGGNTAAVDDYIARMGIRIGN